MKLPDSKGRCGYCKDPDNKHHAAECLYLVPERRPAEWWKPPSATLWAYFPKQQKTLADTSTKQEDRDTAAVMVKHVAFAMTSVINESTPYPHWIYDTGASKSVTPDLNIIEDYIPYRKSHDGYCYKTSDSAIATTLGFGYAVLPSSYRPSIYNCGWLTSWRRKRGKLDP